jgi:dimethylargininase
VFQRAIVRPPGFNFAEGLTTVELGRPDYELALEQHIHYCSALQRSGLTLISLEADPRYPDSTFVEDTAILTERGAILTRPGASSRAGEVAAIRDALCQYFPSLYSIESPGTLDGGDICQAGDHFYIGLSERTNESGAEQLAEWLAKMDYRSTIVDIRGMAEILHLKCGISFIGDNRIVITESLAQRESFSGYELIRVEGGEEYAANCVRVNDNILAASGFPALEARLLDLEYQVITLDMSEFQKMDGGLSCLSLRF